MAEFTNNAPQVVQPNQQVALNTSIPCNKGYVYHRNGSGIVTLRGVTPNCFARYQVTFNGNIAIPSTGTISPISVGLAIDGEPIPTSRAIFTPAVVATTDPGSDVGYGNVTSTAIITVPKGCCFNVNVENTSAVPTTPAGANAPAILVKNANLTVTRIA